MNKRTNSDDVIIYKGSHQTVILTEAMTLMPTAAYNEIKHEICSK